MSELKINMTELVGKTYYKIATWHNGEKEAPSSEGLKVISQEIVEEILNAAFDQIGNTKTAIEMDMDTAKENLREDYENYQKEHGMTPEEAPKKKRGLFNFGGGK